MVLSNSKFPLIFLQSLLVSFLFSCGNGDEKTDVKETDLLSQRAAFEIASVPLPIASGDSILFSALVADSSLKFDSVVVKIDDQRILSWKEKPGSFLWPSANMGMGKHVFRLAGFYKGNENGSGSMIFSIASNIIPEEFGFEIVKTMAHNPSSFTQGLEWQSDKLFEGTGLNGKSVVMQINPSNGDALKKVNLDKLKTQWLEKTGNIIEANNKTNALSLSINQDKVNQILEVVNGVLGSIKLNLKFDNLLYRPNQTGKF
jgi:glutaminyl-peptide cyclotransferase